jgi:hypothetical protein
MPERPDIWLLACGEKPVAELVVEQLDRPWVRDRVVPWDGVVRFAGARATTSLGRTGTIRDPTVVATELTLASGAPAIGPDPAGLTGNAGSATPGGLSADGTSFTVTVNEAQAAPGPPPITAAALPRHNHRAPAVRHAHPSPAVRQTVAVGEGW